MKETTFLAFNFLLFQLKNFFENYFIYSLKEDLIVGYNLSIFQPKISMHSD